MVDLFSAEPYDNISDPPRGPKRTTPNTYERETPMSFGNVFLCNAPVEFPVLIFKCDPNMTLYNISFSDHVKF